MATTKNKSTKAKPKTTKPVLRSQGKNSATKATKTTKKSVSVKAVKTTTAQKVKKPYTFQLQRLNLASGLLAIILAATAGFLMNDSTYQIFTGLLTADELASKTSAIFIPAVHSVFDLELRWAVVFILLVSAIIPLLAATKKRKQFEDSLEKNVMLWRWIDMAVVSALIVEVIALLSGVRDLMTLKFIGAFMVITCVLGWFAEKQNANSAKPERNNFYLSLITGSLPWIMIAVYALGTLLWGQVRSPWYVYVLYITTLAAFTGYVGNQSWLRKAKQSYEVTERNYILLSIFVKVAFAVILIIGLYKK